MAMFSLGMITSSISRQSYCELQKEKKIKYNIRTSSNFLTGLFMASRASIIACGTRMAVFAMAMKFVVGPALMAVSSIATGLRGKLFRVAIVQVQKYSFCTLHSG